MAGEKNSEPGDRAIEITQSEEEYREKRLGKKMNRGAVTCWNPKWRWERENRAKTNIWRYAIKNSSKLVVFSNHEPKDEKIQRSPHLPSSQSTCQNKKEKVWKQWRENVVLHMEEKQYK